MYYIIMNKIAIIIINSLIIEFKFYYSIFTLKT